MIAFLEAKRKKAEEEGIKEEGTLEQIKALEKEQALDDAMQAAGGQQPGGQAAQAAIVQEAPAPEMKQELKDNYPEPQKDQETVENPDERAAKSTFIKSTWRPIPQAEDGSSVVQPETSHEQADTAVQAATATS